jgi:hypothetical protein
MPAPGVLVITRAIVPVLGLTDDHRVKSFLGTRSVVSDGRVLLTADHVIRDWSGPLGIAIIDDLETIYPLEVIERDPAARPRITQDCWQLRAIDEATSPLAPSVDLDE